MPASQQFVRSLRVLVVEDEYFVAEELASALRGRDFEVIGPVSSCQHALAMMTSGGVPDVAIVDINLRGEATFVVADALVEHQIPFVFATGYDRAMVPARFSHVPLWEKPFGYEALVRSIETAYR